MIITITDKTEIGDSRPEVNNSTLNPFYCEHVGCCKASLEPDEKEGKEKGNKKHNKWQSSTLKVQQTYLSNAC